MLLIFLSATAAPQGRVVAIGDVHGDFDAFVTILQQAGLIDARHRWAGGNATLVQTGDFLDRGPKSHEVMDLLMTLEKQAPKDRGRVVVLMGNHEAMNLIGDLRYVAAADYGSFADPGSERRRKAAYEAYAELQKKLAEQPKRSRPALTPAAEKQWMDAHPPGFIEHREAFGPDGKYGQWLRAKPAIAEIDGTIFLHGGLNPAMAALKLNAISDRVKNEIRAFDTYKQYLVQQKLALAFFTLDELIAVAQAELEARKTGAAQKSADAAREGKAYEPTEQERQHIKLLEDFLSLGGWLIIHQDGPLWFRGFANWTDQEGERHLPNLLGAYGAARFVVGHTPQRDGQIHHRFGSKVFLIDTGMLASYYLGGKASALEIFHGKFTAIYKGQRTVLLDTATTRSQGRQ